MKISIIAFLVSKCLMVSQVVSTMEMFTRLNPDDEIVFFHDKTIEFHEFSTTFRLKCIQECILLDSSCQFIRHINKRICTIYSAIEKTFFKGENNIYLREKKLPRVHFLNGSFLEQNQLKIISLDVNLNLKYNYISLITPFAFEILEKIEILELSFNSLSKICSKSFYGMANLKILLLNSNQIKQFEPDAFQGIPKLRSLNLNRNSISHLDKNLFDDLKELVSIDLNSNQIELLERPLFKNLQNLKTIYLGYNKLKSLEPVFDNLVSLDLLDVSNNQIITIHNDTFKSLKTIRILSIDSNQISEISSETFKGAVNLDLLKLGSNKLQRVHKNFSLNFQNLTHLDMSYNNLSFIEADFFNGLTKLKYLYLFVCDIKEIDLSSLVNLEYLNLRYNKIQYFSQNLSSLTSLYLNFNPLINLSYPLISSENSKLEYLGISNCQLNYIDFNYLKNFINLRSLSINGNLLSLDNQAFSGFISLKEVFVNSEDVVRFETMFPNITFKS